MSEQRLNLIECELKRLNDVVNNLENKLNQLNQGFMAHRDRGDIHGRTKMVG